MGAQTMRRLAQLLGQGSAEEMAATPPGQISPLFTGGKANWIDSITTISGTHNGSSLTNITQQVLPTAPQLLAVAALFGNVDQQLIGYDFNLDQWGLTRMPGESLAQFISRINASGFAHSKDTAETDLLPDTAAMLNQAVTAQPDNFLFSVQTLTTQAGANDFQVAEGSTDPPLIPLANAIGKFTSNKGQIPITPQWWPNDGLTNTNFMPGPILNTTDVIATFNGQSVQRAKWYPLGTLDMVDHLQVIGFGTQDPKPLYRTLAAFVASLPQ
jgi:triacylglycerol lipase